MLVNLISFSRRGVTLLLLLNPTLHSTLLLRFLKIIHFLLLLHISAFGLQISASLFADAYQIYLLKVTCYNFCGYARLHLSLEKSLLKHRGTYHFPLGFHPVSHCGVFPVPFLIILVVGRSVLVTVMYSLSASLLVSFLWVFMRLWILWTGWQPVSPLSSYRNPRGFTYYLLLMLGEHPQALDMIGPRGSKISGWRNNPDKECNCVSCYLQSWKGGEFLWLFRTSGISPVPCK